MMKDLHSQLWCLLSMIQVLASTKIELPGNCPSGQYYEPGFMNCQACPANASLVSSIDGLGCTCDDHSVPAGLYRCKPCNATEVVSSDGSTCVPRRCQNTLGRIVCRKCPNDYITVTQNLDGSALKEVQCIKCARGFKAQNNVCVRCEVCTCTKQQIIVKDICITKKYVNSRPKYEENSLHPKALLDVVKHEYLCTQNDVRACRTLASECVKNFYSFDPAGPCRLWIHANISKPKGLPPLTVESTLADKYPGETNLPRGQDTLTLAVAVFTSDEKFKLYKDTGQKNSECYLPINIKIGQDFTKCCTVNMSQIKDETDTATPYLYIENSLIQIPVFVRKPNGYSVQKGTWSSNSFKRYFIVDRPLSTMTNTTNTVYLQTMLINIRIQRDKTSEGSLKVYVSVDVNYAMKSSLTDVVVTTLNVVHVMPEAGVHRGLEIWGGVLGCISVLHALIQWRGVIQRSGLYISAAPLLASAVADTLYFATMLSTLHPLAAEAGTISITLPLSSPEELIIKVFIYTSVALKGFKVAWLNFKQCRCDIFFLDWSEYNSPFKDGYNLSKSNNWRSVSLAREWSRMQTIRRVSPDLTVTLALVVFHVLTPWLSYLPQSFGYKWAIGTIAWWFSYSILLLARWVVDRLGCSQIKLLPKLCTNIGLSLLVFEEDCYAHYVHGRNDDTKDSRNMAVPLAACRVVCAPQLRIVYKQLANTIPEHVRGEIISLFAKYPGLGETENRQALLSRFLAAFFERALDGLSWVASERTIFERLLDVELTTREAGNTSTLLYDPEDNTPSCFAVTWWGEEWTLSTFDAMVFGCVLLAANDVLLAALLTLIVWQIMKMLRRFFGDRNQRIKTEIEF